VAELIACHDTRLFEACSCPWTPSSTFDTLLYMERWAKQFLEQGREGQEAKQGRGDQRVPCQPAPPGQHDVSA
jgi:hypothetical protein